MTAEQQLIENCRAIVRRLADRQNSDSTLKQGEATFIVSTCLSAANILETELRRQGVLPPANPPAVPQTAG